MLKHWKEKVFKKRFVNYNYEECMLLGPAVFPGEYERINLEKISGDVVIFQVVNGGKDCAVAIAVCSDGTWIKGLE